MISNSALNFILIIASVSILGYFIMIIINSCSSNIDEPDSNDNSDVNDTHEQYYTEIDIKAPKKKVTFDTDKNQVIHYQAKYPYTPLPHNI